VKIDRMRRELGLPLTVDHQQYRFWNALYFLASLVALSDEAAEQWLRTPVFREKPELLEAVTGPLYALQDRDLNLTDQQRRFEEEARRQGERAERAERLHPVFRQGPRKSLNAETQRRRDAETQRRGARGGRGEERTREKRGPGRREDQGEERTTDEHRSPRMSSSRLGGLA
jgi:hypothetical protein